MHLPLLTMEGTATTRMPAAVAAAMPLGESSITRQSAGSTFSLAAVALYVEQVGHVIAIKVGGEV